jgi:hypothetical protein
MTLFMTQTRIINREGLLKMLENSVFVSQQRHKIEEHQILLHPSIQTVIGGLRRDSAMTIDALI